MFDSLTASLGTDNSSCLFAKRVHEIQRGAEILPSGRVRFSIWAPAAHSIHLELDGVESVIAMSRAPSGWFDVCVNNASAGTRYSFVLPDTTRVPDPASRFQPDDVHGPSEVIDPSAYEWKDTTWTGRPWNEAVLYELHLGAFTPEGTYLAAIAKLDHLVNLGVTAIQIMPIADFPGKWNWGYDGALWYAPDSAYGRPEDLKRFIDEAHSRDLMVLLDVVYNHFGPDGNYLPVYAPQTLTKRHKTAWGDAINTDDAGSEVVREFVVHNALYWLKEYHFDGLRLDAVHAIRDDGPRHLLDELAERVRTAIPNREVHLVLENESNEAFRLRRNLSGGATHYTAQWNDDIHHALHTAATLDSNGYYQDFKGDTNKLGKALAEGFAFQGEFMQSSQANRGEPSSYLSPTAFVSFIQNHDQIGNRAFGERINQLTSPEALRAIASVYLLSPQIPMLFMGEEWGANQPFPYFCDFEGDLGEQIRKGRKEEFASFPEFQDRDKREQIPNPLSHETFSSAKLDWNDLGVASHATWLAWYRQALQARTKFIVPLLNRIGAHAGSYHLIGPGAIMTCWYVDDGRVLGMAANLSDHQVGGFPRMGGQLIWQEGCTPTGSMMEPWSVQCFLQERPQDV